MASCRGGRGIGDHGHVAIRIGCVGSCAFARSHLVIVGVEAGKSEWDGMCVAAGRTIQRDMYRRWGV